MGRKSRSQRITIDNPVALVLVAIIGLIGVLVTAYFAYQGSVVPVGMSISATETAEASATLASNAPGADAVASQMRPIGLVEVSTSSPVVQIDDLISHPDTVSAESLAALVGGDPAHWSQRGPMVWGYYDPGVVASFRHPGHGLVLSYWAGYPEPESAEDCRVAIPVSDPETRYLKCPRGTKAKIEADGVGLHIEDDTEFFEP